MNPAMPLTWLTKNLVYTRQGTVWGVWRLAAMPYGLRPARAKRLVHAAHVGLLRAIKGEYMLMGTCATVDPAEVVQRMIRRVDLSEHQLWAQEAEATLDLLEDLELGQRTFWLAAPLASRGPIDVLRRLGYSTVADVGDTFGLPLARPSEQDVASRLQQAEQVLEAIPRSFGARAATAAEVGWLFLHAQQRGVAHEAALPVNLDGRPDPALLRAGSAIPAPVLDPGGQSDLKTRVRFNPLKRRYVKVTDVSSDTTTYQSSLTILDAPAGGLIFPGSEWIGRLDECGVDADWTIRVRSRARQKVIQANKKALRELSDQYDQQGTGTTMTSGLDHTADLLADYDQRIAADELEIELSFATIITVGAPTGEEAMQKVQAVRNHLGPTGWGFKVTVEPGAQEALWRATLPGMPTTPQITRLEQLAPSRDLATSVPFTTPSLGDPEGLLLGLETSSRLLMPVLIDVDSATSKLDGAIAMAVCGELGAGKTITLMKVSTGLVDRGAQLLVLDRTEVGEWAAAFGGRTEAVVVDITEDAQWSMDPLRVLPDGEGAGAAQSFLQNLLHVSASSPQGIVLSTVLAQQYRAAHNLTSLSEVMEHLATGQCDRPGSQQLGDTMRAFAQHSWARTIFDPTLPPAPVTAPVLVLRTHRLELPSPDELNIAHRFETLPLTKIFGRAIHTLATALGRWICFRDPSRLAGLVVDEAAAVTASPESQSELEVWLRDGRKHRAFLLLGSHDAEADFGNEVLRELIPARLVMRHRTEKLAIRALRWLGLDETDQNLIDMVTSDLSPMPADGELPDPTRRGEGIYRDFRNRTGRIQVLPPADPQAAARVFTTPPEAA